MAPNPRRIDQRLQELYDQIPALDCQGFCADSCGPIDLSVRECARMEQASGHKLGCVGISCNMLTEDRKCSVYELRPMICRIWGVSESLPCHYGCKPERYLSDYECAMLIAESLKVGGGMTHADRELARLLKAAQEEFGQEGFADAVRAAMRTTVVRPSLLGRTPPKGLP